ncbi:hypothetical protein THAOC_23616, partial [Thalassiosira oceanica]
VVLPVFCGPANELDRHSARMPAKGPGTGGDGGSREIDRSTVVDPLRSISLLWLVGCGADNGESRRAEGREGEPLAVLAVDEGGWIGRVSLPTMLVEGVSPQLEVGCTMYQAASS